MSLKNLSEQNISTKVLDELRESIQNGELEPGSRLIERKLAERMGVSHIPVREALAILTEERLVERQPRRGARVAALTEEDLNEITSLRIVLEQFVVLRVQERWEPKAEKRLRKIVDAMRRAAARCDADTMFSLDHEFHDALWQLSEHRLLVDVTAKLRGRMIGFLRVANKMLKPEQFRGHAETHNAIVEAIASGDRDRVNAVIAEHIGTAAVRISEVARAASRNL